MSLRVLRLDKLRKPMPIFDQLVLEEALFRANCENWCILNRGCGARAARHGPESPTNSPTDSPTVVMGIGGKPAKLLDLDAVHRDGVGVVRRFTGGGTVVVDEGTLFATFIMNHDALQHRGLPDSKYPRPIMEWSGRFYAPVFDRLCAPSRRSFGLYENDYVLVPTAHDSTGSGDGRACDALKFGGNAQSISRGRWVHHTSFLWDFTNRSMAYLQLPDKRPTYRDDRAHGDFLVRLSDAVGNMAQAGEDVLEQIAVELPLWFDEIVPAMLEDGAVSAALASDHRRATRWVDVDEHM